MSKGKVTVVGAGLVGSLLSIFLAKRGFSVDLLERRADPRINNTDRGRSINLAISVRGLHALERIGLKDAALAQAVRMPGRMIHLKDCSTHFYPYGIHPHEAINSISRGGLNELLINEAEKTGRVEIRFNTKVTGYNPKSAELEILNTVTNSNFITKTVPVIGTDGSASAIRTGLVKECGADISDIPLNYGYKEFNIPPEKSGTKDGEANFQLDPHALHIWPRATHMLIALPNSDGSFTVTLFIPFKGEKSLENLSDTESVASFFKEEFPDAYRVMPTLLADFVRNPTGHMSTIKSSKWHFEGNCLLLGDAAHAIVPFFGQGMNAGFEDLSVLEEILDETDTDWGIVFAELFKRRKINTDSIADMAEENFIEMRDKVADEKFQAERQIEKKLEKEFPDLYISRYRMVSFTRIPYEIARKAGKVENELLATLHQKYKTSDALDLVEAKRAITQKLVPILSPYLRDIVIDEKAA